MCCHGSGEDGVQGAKKLESSFLKLHLSVHFDLEDMEQGQYGLGLGQHATVDV